MEREVECQKYLDVLTEYDLKNNPRLRVELKKVQRRYPLRIPPDPFSKPKIGPVLPLFPSGRTEILTPRLPTIEGRGEQGFYEGF